MALYLYFVGACINVIILLNHLSLLVLYNILQKKFQDITKSTSFWIKAQGFVSTLVKSWDNFELCENVHDKQTGNTVKF